MLMVAPNGSTKLATSFFAPSFCTQSILIGSVPTEDALEKIVTWESDLPKDQKFCAVSGNLGTAPDVTPNTLLTEAYLDGDAFSRYGPIDGERAFAFYTDIHRQYLYPEYEGEKFMTEAIAWNRMAHDGYKIRYFNDIIWIYDRTL